MLAVLVDSDDGYMDDGLDGRVPQPRSHVRHPRPVGLPHDALGIGVARGLARHGGPERIPLVIRPVLVLAQDFERLARDPHALQGFGGRDGVAADMD
ncbi:hypothetical protein LCGC14_3016610, partial [marine sediment metagenome]